MVSIDKVPFVITLFVQMLHLFVCFVLLYEGSYFRVHLRKFGIAFIFGVSQFDLFSDVFRQRFELLYTFYSLECGVCLIV